MKIKITADSTIDLSKELLEKFGIETIAFSINVGEETYLDGINLQASEIYDLVDKTGELPKTSAINEESYNELFKKYTDQGYGVIHFNLSSKISLTHSNAKRAAENFDNVYVIDSLSLSTGTALLALYACELRDQNVGIKEIVEKVTARIDKVQASFIINKLTYLHKGGRCSSLQLLGANLLKIKPCIEVKDGKMGMARKYRGNMEKIADTYVRETLETFSKPDLTRVFVTHTDCEPEIIEAVKVAVKKYGNFKEILETKAGCTITSHCGKNTIGVLYINDGE